ncbi:alpha/beta hydrolase family protein [Pseudodesulfovibrio sp.]|uniref:alpha/beta hydrolase family protein n=1 Tax=unclassified Pseudodesulfovibrio TaxID=2661612 RepID=UPI003AFFC74F
MARLAVSLMVAVSFFLASGVRAGTFQAKGDKPASIVFEDESYDFELRRVLGMAVAGGSDINECLETARRIREGDAESWYTHWYALGERIRRLGESSLERGHEASARESFFRASTYYRNAGFFLVGNPRDPRIRDSWRKSRDVFRKGAKLLDHPAEVVDIPYEGTTLPGYLLLPDDTGQPRKTVIIQTGFDGTAEELYFENARFALERGWAVLLFEGPGQGGVLREQGLTFRPDWEKVIMPVVDFALGRKEVAPDKVVLMGISMGGYLAPRGAAFEPRLAALVANPGNYDLFGHREPTPELWARMRSDRDAANREMRAAMAKDIGFRWFIENGMFTTGTKTPLAFMEFYDKFTMKGLAGSIACPTLVVAGSGDHFASKKDEERLYDELKCRKTLLVFDQSTLASGHCQMGAMMLSNQKIFDWLDEMIGE